jgi:N-acetylglucosamine kinase-like BadF-type ATPase
MLAAAYAWSQRGPKTRITQLLMDYAQVDSEGELIEGLATDKIQLNPGLAKEIFRLAREEDLQAQEAVRFTAHELALNVNAVIRQLEFENCDFEIVMMGSVFNAGEIYINPFKETILQFAPQAKFVRLSVPPVVGSVLLAAEALSLPTRPIRNTLTQSIKEISF